VSLRRWRRPSRHHQR